MGRRTKIFISYRRDDAKADARSVYQALERSYGARKLFMDVDSIKRGHDFRAVLEQHLSETAVMLVLIGEKWLDLAGPDGARRLDDPADFVRLEIATALRDGIPVIPVLIDDAAMPGAAALPEEISGLAYRQSLRLRHESFRSDVGDLHQTLKETLATGALQGAIEVSSAAGAPPPRRRSSGAVWVFGFLFLAAALGGGAFLYLDFDLSSTGAVEKSEQATERYREIQAALKTLGFYRLAVDGDWGAASEAALKRYQTQEGIEPDGRPTRSMQISLRKAAAAEAAQQEAERRRREAEEKEKARIAALHRDIRAELTRLGDFSGSLEGGWNAASEAALKRFEKREGLALRGAPTVAILTTLKKATKPTTFADRLKAAGKDGLKECDACPVMVAIPGGRFTMGSPASEPGRSDREGPQRRTTIQPFAIGKFEVTFAEWDSCVADGGCGGYWPKDEGWGRGDRPVINVSWSDAKAYAKWLNTKAEGSPYRLPSEAEWEYAARAGTTTPFWWGGSITPDQANYRGNLIYEGGGSNGVFRDKTLPVKSFQPNPLGLYQVHGNVLEWVEDCQNSSYLGAPKDGSVWRKGDCSRAVFRGGSWSNHPSVLRSANRGWTRRSGKAFMFGFRIARTLAD